MKNVAEPRVVVAAPKDGVWVLLPFASMKDGQAFVDFVRTYMTDTGAGNGYCAYWVFDKVLDEDGRPPELKEDADITQDGFTNSLDMEIVEYMINQIADARSGGDDAAHKPSLTYGVTDGFITFELGEFDPRKTPAVGDMYRVHDWSQVPGDRAVIPGEGRVLSIEGDHATVYGCHDESDEGGSPKNGAKTHIIPLEATLKIPDWLARNR